jgi:hypothetical protein
MKQLALGNALLLAKRSQDSLFDGTFALGNALLLAKRLQCDWVS